MCHSLVGRQRWFIALLLVLSACDAESTDTESADASVTPSDGTVTSTGQPTGSSTLTASTTSTQDDGPPPALSTDDSTPANTSAAATSAASSSSEGLGGGANISPTATSGDNPASGGAGGSGSDSDVATTEETDTGDHIIGFPPDRSDSSDEESASSSSSDGNSSVAEMSDAGDTPAMGGTLEVGKLAGMTAAHNEFRAMVDTDEPLPPLVWSDEIAALAQEWADDLATDCRFEHSHRPGLGENLAEFGTSVQGFEERAAYQAVKGWYDELSCYEYSIFTKDGGGTCSSECDQFGGCGHYTQVVWRDSERVGCGVASCEGDGYFWDIYVCNYDPPGNYIGQYPY